VRCDRARLDGCARRAPRQVMGALFALSRPGGPATQIVMFMACA
jgi:hypothetical protein